MKAFLLLCFVSFLVGCAHTRTPRAGENSALLEFDTPTHNNDGSVIPATKTPIYNIYQGARGQTDKAYIGAVTDPTSQTPIYAPGLTGEVCWNVETEVDGVRSDWSNEACKTFQGDVDPPDGEGIASFHFAVTIQHPVT